MITEVLPDSLQYVPLFSNLSPDDIGRILDRCETINYQPGDVVIRMGDREVHAYAADYPRFGRGANLGLGFTRWHVFDKQSGERLRRAATG